MCRSMAFYLFVICVLMGNAQSINVRGKVTNAGGAPISKAVVTLLHQGLKDTTGADGAYAIVNNDAAVRPYLIPQREKIAFNKGVLELSLTGSSPVTVEVMDVKGTLLKKEVLSHASKGVYHLDVVGAFRTAGLLVIHASIGRREMTFRYLPLDNRVHALHTSETTSEQAGGGLAKITADVDSLEVAADGYLKKVVKVDSYDVTVDITLDTMGEVLCEGCGKTDHPESGKKTIQADGMEREYILKLPDNYDPGQQYKLIFCIHAWGGNMDQIAQQGYYGLEKLSKGTAIFVSPQGLEDDGNPRGWFNPNGRDIKFIKAMLDFFNANLCIDQERIFSTGFSFGGMMSFAIGCSFHNVFRAIAPMSGAFYSGCDESDQGPIAVWMAHGKSDKTVPLNDGKKARDYFLERNGCSTETVPVEPSPCVAYQGCDEDAPFIYCEFEGGHAPQNWAQKATWDFFSQF